MNRKYPGTGTGSSQGFLFGVSVPAAMVLDIRPCLCQKQTKNNHYVKLVAGFRYNEFVISKTGLS